VIQQTSEVEALCGLLIVVMMHVALVVVSRQVVLQRQSGCIAI
jgi:hypothetical protein